jgi:lipopolysaccharide transport system ATP-binding protein
MSSDVVVSARDLSKCYQIYEHPRDRLRQFFSSVEARVSRRPVRQHFREFWALRDVSLEIRRGETVAIVGRNGSGKSTFLQLVCGTLNPSGGTVAAFGRVAALLELGSGFNPEFTGRENVFLNAGVLGLTREQTIARFPAIEAFADIGQFIDQPVKTYSSGMMVRLAFAVVAHVDADLLVIDEALAVGDAVFTQKCMRFIRSYQERGTLLFVSHDMGSVVNLCSRAVWLDQGRVRQTGDAKSVSQAYLEYTLQSVYGEEAKLETVGAPGQPPNAPAPAPAAAPRKGAATPATADSILDYQSSMGISENIAHSKGFRTGAAELLKIEFQNLATGSATVLQGGEKVRVRVEARANVALERPIIGFVFNDRLGQALFGENTLPFTATTAVSADAGQVVVAEFVFRLPMLPNGDYAVFASIADGDLHNNVQHHLLHDAAIVKVSSSKVRWGLVGVPFEHVSLKTKNV